jgi:DNA-binding CsgD family transcriptional regulator
MVADIYAATSATELAAAAVAGMHRHLNALVAQCDEVSNDGSSYAMHGLVTERHVPLLDAAPFVHDHPAVIYMTSGSRPSTFRLGQIVTKSRWRSTDYYNYFARAVGFDDQIIATYYSPRTYGGFGVERDTAFTDREFELVKLLRPHLQAASSRVRMPSDSPGIDPMFQIHLSQGLRPDPADMANVHRLAGYFPRSSAREAVPSELRQWIACSVKQLGGGVGASPLRPFLAQSAKGKLWIRLFPDMSTHGVLLRLVEQRSRPDFTRLRRRGFTARECEVLHWIASGKRDAEVAVILGSTVRTINKHVENCLAKFGVANRTGAIRSALTALED